ncbi:MAG: DUF898 family protein [Pseudomonadota bacterium]
MKNPVIPASMESMGPLVRHEVEFSGSVDQYRRQWARDTLLLLLTFGLYYPWAMVRKFKYLYGHTHVAGHPLGYHASALPLFIGNVIGSVLLNAMFYGLSKTGQYALVGQAALQLLLAALTPLFLHGFLEFQLTHTSWRGQRLGLAAKPADAYRAMGAPTLVYMAAGVLIVWAVMVGKAGQSGLATGLGMAGSAALCIALPFMFHRYKCYQHQFAVYGILRNQRAIPVVDTSKVWMRASAVALVVMFALVWPLALWLSHAVGFDLTKEITALLLFVVPFLFIATALFMAWPYPYLSVQLQNQLWSETAHDQIRFESRVDPDELLKLTRKNWFLIVCTLGYHYPSAVVSEAKLRQQAVSVWLSSDLLEEADQLPKNASSISAGKG